MSKQTAAIVLCAGKGTRMHSKTSKLLHPLCGQPLCFYALDAITQAIEGPIVVVVGHEAEVVQAALEQRYGKRLIFAFQAEQLGTGNAVSIGLQHVPQHVESILVMCGDTPLLHAETLTHLVQWQRRQQLAVAMLTAKAEHPAGYGRILRNLDGDITAIVEEKDATYRQRLIQEINAGVYAFEAEFLRSSLPKLTTDNQKHEYYLTDVVHMATDKQGSVAGIEVKYKETIGVNDRRDLAKATALLREHIVKKAMHHGVTCEDPKTTYIDATVQLGKDIVLEPGVILKGNTTIGDDAIIGAYSILTDCEVAKHARIEAHCVCEGAVIGERAHVGPFARLRTEAKLDEGVKIGNFVEVKKSHFKEGAKANHLAYIGDAKIGAFSNIGAGTITCNYDGSAKYPTVMGDKVFIGSNSTLVAPVTIEEGAYVGAGSVITEVVPKDALALGRSRQVNKEGYGKAMREKRK